MVLSWGVLGIVVSRPQSELKMICCSGEGISGKFGNSVDLLNPSDVEIQSVNLLYDWARPFECWF